MNEIVRLGLTGLQVARVLSTKFPTVAMVPNLYEKKSILRQWCQMKKPLPCSKVSQGQSDKKEQFWPSRYLRKKVLRYR